MKHINEPWNFSTTDIGTFIIHEGLILAKVRELEGIDHKANAARIVDCVNAMAGKDDPDHFVKMAEAYIQQDKDIRLAINADSNESTLDEVIRVSAQNSRLKEALKSLIDAVKFRTPSSPATIHELIEAEKVLNFCTVKKEYQS